MIWLEVYPLSKLGTGSLDQYPISKPRRLRLSSMTWVSSAKRQLESLLSPPARAAMIRARLVRLLEPGGVNSAVKGLWTGWRVMSLIVGQSYAHIGTADTAVAHG